MNEEIENILYHVTVSGEQVPVSFLQYGGKSAKYITYQEVNVEGGLNADNQLIGLISYYDIDIYSRDNYLAIIKKVKTLMRNAGWMWQPGLSSGDLYDRETGYFHKTLCFAKEYREGE